MGSIPEKGKKIQDLRPIPQVLYKKEERKNEKEEKDVFTYIIKTNYEYCK